MITTKLGVCQLCPLANEAFILLLAGHGFFSLALGGDLAFDGLAGFLRWRVTFFVDFFSDRSETMMIVLLHHLHPQMQPHQHLQLPPLPTHRLAM
jgi:hypothetical protein